MYKTHGKHDQHYLVYKFTCFSCNPSCRRCLNRSTTDSHSGFSRAVYSIRIGDPLEPKLLSYWILTARCLLEWPPWLIRCMVETLVYLSCWSRGKMTLPPILSRAPQECVCNVDFVDLTKGPWVPVQRICMKYILLQTLNDQCKIWDIWSVSLILNSYVENWIYPCRNSTKFQFLHKIC